MVSRKRNRNQGNRNRKSDGKKKKKENQMEKGGLRTDPDGQGMEEWSRSQQRLRVDHCFPQSFIKGPILPCA